MSNAHLLFGPHNILKRVAKGEKLCHNILFLSNAAIFFDQYKERPKAIAAVVLYPTLFLSIEYMRINESEENIVVHCSDIRILKSITAM